MIVRKYWYLCGASSKLLELGTFISRDHAEQSARNRELHCVWIFDEEPAVSKPATYNHAMTISFSVSGSKHGDGNDCILKEPHLVCKALQERVSILNRMAEQNHPEYLEMIETYDTYEEFDNARD